MMCLRVVARLPQRLKSMYFWNFSFTPQPGPIGSNRSSGKKQKKPVDFSHWGKQCSCFPKLHFFVILAHCVDYTFDLTIFWLQKEKRSQLRRIHMRWRTSTWQSRWKRNLYWRTQQFLCRWYQMAWCFLSPQKTNDLWTLDKPISFLKLQK